MKRPTFSTEINPQVIYVYSLSMNVRITDVNYGNHLAATAVPSMMHQVRLKFLTTHGFSESNIAGVGLVISDIYVHYHSETFFDHELQFELGVEHISKNTIDLVYRITNMTQQKITAMAKERVVFLNYQTRKVAATPEPLISVIKQLEKLSV